MEVYIVEQVYEGYEAVFSTLDKAIEFTKDENHLDYGEYIIFKEYIDRPKTIPILMAYVKYGVVELKKENDDDLHK